MPSQPNDPIVEILILAYRRGLAIRQNSQPAAGEGATPFKSQTPYGKGRLCDDGENANSRNCTLTKGHHDESANSV